MTVQPIGQAWSSGPNGWMMTFGAELEVDSSNEHDDLVSTGDQARSTAEKAARTYIASLTGESF